MKETKFQQNEFWKGFIFLFAVIAVQTAFASGSKASKQPAFGFDEVIQQAAGLAQKIYDDSNGQIPEFLNKISYDQWRDIRYKPENILWRKESGLFRVDFFHPGFIYNKTVKINVIDGDKVKPVSFDTDLFHYGMNDFKGRITPETGFAGFRIRFPINSPSVYDEFLVFLGASYFRAVGKGQTYGLSARGLAIDTALDSGEEFPWFKEFWLQKPLKNAKTLIIYALLDSPSMTGAYQFVVRPEEETRITVSGKIYKRKDINKLGIAPLTSMFFYGENMNQRPIDDFRPEVHDSDGLLIAGDGGKEIWRPLVNPKTLQIISFNLKDPKGFGLLQRDLNFDHYQDLEARYDLRPGAWISPKGKWGEGRVELVQIPSKQEWDDNIICYWVPAESMQKKREMAFSYDIIWRLSKHSKKSKGVTLATRTMVLSDSKMRRFVIDFGSRKLNSLSADAPVKAEVNIKGADIIEQHIQKNQITKGWRLVFDISLEKKGPLAAVLSETRKNDELFDLRAYLVKDNEVLTETWSYFANPF